MPSGSVSGGGVVPQPRRRDPAGNLPRVGPRREADRGPDRTLKLAQSTVSAHVACLRDCGLVDGRPVGRQMLYRLTHPQLLTLLSAAEQLLVATGSAVDLCPGLRTRP